jgi:hypothetical protein
MLLGLIGWVLPPSRIPAAGTSAPEPDSTWPLAQPSSCTFFARVSQVSWLEAAMEKCAAKDGGSALTCVANDETLTQYGTEGEPGRPTFHSRRKEGQPGLSILRGKKSPAEAAAVVRGRSGIMPSRDRARYTTAGKLRKAGFEVIHTPTRLMWGHCSVVLLGSGGALDEETEWSDEVSSRFNGCFAGGRGGL